MVLDRDSLKSGAFLQSFRETPDIEWWSEEHIAQSMRETLQQRIRGEPVWLFAYGSLIFNPLFQVEESTLASLDGWHRSFCIRLVLARGTPERPGRMLALEKGGCCEGIALRFREDQLDEELGLIWTREMVGGVYRPHWTTVTLASGQRVRAIIFTANINNILYEQDASVTTAAPLIAAASGSLGSNKEYVMRLHDALRHHGISDHYIHKLAAALQ